MDQKANLEIAGKHLDRVLGLFPRVEARFSNLKEISNPALSISDMHG
jgi:hypothetical protein